MHASIACLLFKLYEDYVWVSLSKAKLPLAQHITIRQYFTHLVGTTLLVQVGGTLALAWVGPQLGRGGPAVAVPVPLLVGHYYPVVATASVGHW